MASDHILTYDEVLAKLPDTKHLLLGNGFSIACDPIFNYPNLFDFAKKKGLTKHVQEVFNYLGTNNFEGVMRLLDDSLWISKHYRLVVKKGNKTSGNGGRSQLDNLSVEGNDER